jgi:transposase InsO family protein
MFRGQCEYSRITPSQSGATMKAATVLAMLHWLGIKASYSRPHVSDENAFIEAMFGTTNYRPQLPASSFANPQAARSWASQFVAGIQQSDYRISPTASTLSGPKREPRLIALTVNLAIVLILTPELLSFYAELADEGFRMRRDLCIRRADAHGLQLH